MTYVIKLMLLDLNYFGEQCQILYSVYGVRSYGQTAAALVRLLERQLETHSEPLGSARDEVTRHEKNLDFGSLRLPISSRRNLQWKPNATHIVDVLKRSCKDVRSWKCFMVAHLAVWSIINP